MRLISPGLPNVILEPLHLSSSYNPVYLSPLHTPHSLTPPLSSTPHTFYTLISPDLHLCHPISSSRGLVQDGIQR